MLTTTTVIAATVGLLLVVMALAVRSRERRDALLELLELPYAEEEADQVEHLADRTGLLEPGIGAMGKVLERLEVADRLATTLERARIALRPGEFVLGVATAAIAATVWVGALTGQLLLGAVAGVATPLIARVVLHRRIDQRLRRIEEELPTALTLLASSLTAGHTLARSMDLMSRETSGPLSEEFEVVLAETRLGSPLTEAMERMAERVELEDLSWVVRAIRIQRQTGGKLADLLHTLAEYLLAREEVRREVKVLTAEGRMSAAVLGLLPVVIAVGIQWRNPAYLGELFTMPGIMLLGYAVVSVVLGVFLIMRLVKSVEL